VNTVRRALALLPLLVAACASTAASTKTVDLDEPISFGPLSCPSEPVASPAAPAPEEDDAPLTIQAGAGGLSLDTAGATAGRTLVEIAHAARQRLVVRGRGAGVRLYAHARPRPWRQLVDSIVRATAMEALTTDDGSLLILDPVEARDARRARLNAMIMLKPLETRMIPVAHPRAAAGVVRLLLGCRGRVVAAPRRSVVLVRDVRENLDRAEKLLEQLEARRAVTLKLPPSWRGGQPEPAIRPCARNVERASGRSSATCSSGGAAGDLLRQLALARGEEILVGCGGDAPVYVAVGAALDLRQAAAAIGLRPVDTLAYAAEEVARERERLQRTDRRAALWLRTFPTRNAREVAGVAARMDLGVDVVAYEPGAMVVALGRSDTLELIGRLAEALTMQRDGR
jgi:hypothetical protein